MLRRHEFVNVETRCCESLRHSTKPWTVGRYGYAGQRFEAGLRRAHLAGQPASQPPLAVREHAVQESEEGRVCGEAGLGWHRHVEAAKPLPGPRDLALAQNRVDTHEILRRFTGQIA